jgi:hypothetical protein
MPAWILAVILAFLLGVGFGIPSGASHERSVIGNECRHAGAFTVKRTGFACEVIKK